MIKIYNITNNETLNASSYNEAYNFLKECSRLNYYNYYIVICL
jgi:hypothetical protein